MTIGGSGAGAGGALGQSQQLLVEYVGVLEHDDVARIGDEHVLGTG